jgi:sugar phosphate isomerase/epimerase
MIHPTHSFSRRTALKGAALAAIGYPLLRPLSALAAAPVSVSGRTRGIKLGLASYTLNTLSVDQVIAVVRQLELKTVSLFRLHAPWGTGTVEECRAVVQKFAAEGITVTSTGVVELPNDEAVVRKAFDNVSGAGLRKFVGRPTLESLPLVEKFVREYDVIVAIHNHGPTDRYPKSIDAYNAILPFDRRIGLCVDVGHGWLADEDPAATILAARDRIYEVHLKDTRGPKDGKFSDAGPVIVGRGLLDFKAIMAALVEIKFAHEVEFEYEEPVPNKVPGLAESVGYIRGLLAAM